MVASFSLLKDRADKLIGLAQELRVEGSASVAGFQKLAGKLGFVQSAVMGCLGGCL